jgi:hypothetical protein
MWHNESVNISELLSFRTLSVVRYSKKLENTTIRKLDLFPFSCEEGDTYSVGSLERVNLNHWTLALSKGPNRVSVSSSPEDGNRASFRNVMFSSLFRIPDDKIQNPSNFEWYKQSSEPFRITSEKWSLCLIN